MSALLVGKDESSLITWTDSSILIHRDLELPLGQMVEAARLEGIEIKILSCYRSFEAQLKIWNNKCMGIRPILDDGNNIISPQGLSEWELIQRIMRFSALPGASRHHWGTDMDIVDANAYPTKEYEVQLIGDEYSTKGPFYKLKQWIDIHMNEFGFFHPYAIDEGGVSPEPWHISYEPLSQRFSEEYDMDFFWEFLNTESADQIKLINTVRNHAEEIFERFIV